MKAIILSVFGLVVISSQALAYQYFNDKGGINDAELVQPYDSAPPQHKVPKQHINPAEHTNQVLQNKLTPLQSKQLGQLCGGTPVCECIQTNQQARGSLGFALGAVKSLCQKQKAQ